MTISERIDAIIKEKGLSRRQVAIKAQIPPSTFQSAMARNGGMTIAMIKKVAEALDVDVHDLLSDENRLVYVMGAIDTIDFYTNKGMHELDGAEWLLVTSFRQLNEKNKERILDYLALVSTTEEHKE